MNPTKELDVDQLEIGMFVAQLDRPWLDTPFLFQGFYIRDDDELDELKKHCKKVHVSLDSLQQNSTAAVPDDLPLRNGREAVPTKKKRFSLRSRNQREGTLAIGEQLREML